MGVRCHTPLALFILQVQEAIVFLNQARGDQLQPNPPHWPSSVQVFGPDDPPAKIQAAVNAAYQINGRGGGAQNNGEFSSQRFAFLFMPGRYDVEIPVGYYTQVLGLGALPYDVAFTSERGVFCEEGTYKNPGGALKTFWRAAENFWTQANFSWFADLRGMLWATSQATPLRRLVVEGDLILYEFRPELAATGFASGGFLANSLIKGKVDYGSQQQFFTRNAEVARATGGVWNLVFVGTERAPESSCPADGAGHRPVVTVGRAPVIAEKPYISVGMDLKYYLNVPQVRWGTRGPSFSAAKAAQIAFELVYVADASKDSAATINAQLALGLHVVLSPGIYYLDAPLEIKSANLVLLGLGFATLVATAANPLIRVAAVGGVRVAGILLQAGEYTSDVLLEWGDVPGCQGDARNPGFLHDVFVRVGGPGGVASANVMIRVNSGHVVGDNLWLWRADHTETGDVHGGMFPCSSGLVVNGDNVVMYGLQAEHSLQDQVVWNGNHGATYFFQSELPYDVSDYQHAGYRVNDYVMDHHAYGIGVYHNFRDFPVVVVSGIVAPAHLESSFVSPLSVFLSGQGTMRHILNSRGEETSQALSPDTAMARWLCERSHLPPVIVPIVPPAGGALPFKPPQPFRPPPQPSHHPIGGTGSPPRPLGPLELARWRMLFFSLACVTGVLGCSLAAAGILLRRGWGSGVFSVSLNEGADQVNARRSRMAVEETQPFFQWKRLSRASGSDSDADGRASSKEPS